jgi:hypothetical protein
LEYFNRLLGNFAALRKLHGAAGAGDALVVGRRLGTEMEKAELDALEKSLLQQRPKVTVLSRDQDAMLTNLGGSSMFRALPDGSSTIFLKSNPTRYEVLHELAHLEHFESLKNDFKNWCKLTMTQKEQYVYDALRKSASWATFSSKERQDARDYIIKVGGKAW